MNSSFVLSRLPRAVPSARRPQRTSLKVQAFQMPDAFSKLEQRLLENAASRVSERGLATCVSCKGQGECSCPACSGRGVSTRAVQNRPKETVINKLLSGLNRTRYSGSPDHLTTNRCQVCRGGGVVTCPQCEGKGLRGPKYLLAEVPSRSKSPVYRP